MPSWLGKCLCIVAAITIFDGHLAVVQSWAWASMLWDRSPEMGLSEAVDSTFSGEQPCPLCCAVQEERQGQQERDSQAPTTESRHVLKHLVPVTDCSCRLPTPISKFSPIEVVLILPQTSRADRPPSPPPRFLPDHPLA
ncbi:MAG: hypothetical protein ACPG32_05340 [Akkermansiaceae bacterium]